MRALCIVVWLVGLSTAAAAQCSPVNAVVPGSACINQQFDLTTSTVGSSYEWDLCTGNLYLDPTLTKLASKPAYNRVQDMANVEVNGSHYLFMVHDNDHKVTRINLGTDPRNNAPTVTDLGNPGNLIDRPLSIDLFSAGGLWYAVVLNASQRKLILLSFGSSIENNPTSSLLYQNIGDANSSVGVIREGANIYVLVAEAGKLKILDFGSDVSSTPTYREIVTGVSLAIDFQVIRHCDGWHAFILDYNGKKLYRVDFNATLSSETVTMVTTLIPFSDPYRIAARQEGAKFHVFVTNIAGGVARLDFGSDLFNLTPTVSASTVVTAAAVPSGWSIVAINNRGVWSGFSVAGGAGDVYRFDFPDPCIAGTSIRNVQNPVSVSYSAAGSFEVALKVFQANGTVNVGTFPITVTSNVAPDITFSSQNICAAHDVQFTHQNVSNNIQSFDWDFGDGAPHSTSPNPVKQYVNAGSYNVVLSVTSSNGCVNRAAANLTMYNQPVANFTLPTGLVCTNNEFEFTNTTSDGYAGALTSQWFVDDNPEGTQKNLRYAFAQIGDHAVKLISAIPGCSSEIVKVLAGVKTGPTVGFSVVGQCQDETLIFTNQSLGEIAGFFWDFGNGTQATTADASALYTNKGDYNVYLRTTGVNGCISEMTKPVTIYSIPQPAFTLDLPPFSCAGTPSQFHDNTPVPDDGNLAVRNWTFGDSGTGSGKDPIHTYSTAGDFPVTLVVTTDKGCSATKTATVAIAQSPVADFNFENACLNKAVHFTSATNNIESWQWKIDNSNYSVADPTHIFLTSGNRSVTLKLTGTNDCIATVTKTVYVPPVPLLDFEMTNPCVGQESVFESKIVSPEDPPTLITWQFETAKTLTGNTARFAFDAPGAHAVGITVKNQSGCQYQLVKNVTAYAAPLVSFETSVNTGPAPLDVDFTNKTTGAVSYRWVTNGTQSAATTNFKTTFSNVGDYAIDLIATSDRGCTSSITKDIKVIVPRTELALSQFNLFEDPISGALRNQLMVANASNYAIRSFDVILDLGNGSSIRETINQEIKVGETTTLLLSNSLVAVSSGYVCAEIILSGDEKTDNNKLCTPLAEKSILFTPSPNPATDVINVEVIAPENGTSTARIVDTMGQLTFACQLDLQKGLNRFELDIRSLRPGIYFLTFETGNEKQIHRLSVN